MSRLVILLVVIIISTTGYTQVKNSNTIKQLADKIDRYLLSAVEASKFNGVALVAQNDKIILHKAYGYRDITSKSLNTTTTRFPILSITKSFTAMVILKLAEQNKLSLNDKLNKYLPGFPDGDKVTIEQLLTHTSGIHNYTDDIGEEDSAIVNHPVDKKLVLDIISKKPFSHAPGEDFSYNNSGYYIAGIVIEKITGKSYEQNVRDLVFTPLAMNASGFDFNNLDAGIKATGYQFLTAKEQKPYTFIDSTVGYSAGGIYSTTGDMFKWTQAIAKQQVLSAASWKLAFTRKAGDYGIGFRINKFFGKDYIRHSGGYPGFVSEFIYYPEEKITIILLKNSGNYGEDIWPVTMGISCIMLGQPYDPWEKRTEAKLAADILKEYEGEYLLNNSKFIVSVNDDRLKITFSGGAEFPLLAERKDAFYFENFNTSFRFIRNDKGIVEKMIIHEHGSDTELKKIK